MSKVLVTGAGGFIGSHLCEMLVSRGREVRALVRYNGRGAQGWLDTSPVRIDAGFQKTVEWLRSHLDLYRPDRYAV
jgi:dTDP-glucose 4,6-dehydratase